MWKGRRRGTLEEEHHRDCILPSSLLSLLLYILPAAMVCHGVHASKPSPSKDGWFLCSCALKQILSSSSCLGRVFCHNKEKSNYTKVHSLEFRKYTRVKQQTKPATATKRKAVYTLPGGSCGLSDSSIFLP